MLRPCWWPFGLNKGIRHLDQLSFSRARLKNRLHIYMQKAVVTLWVPRSSRKCRPPPPTSSFPTLLHGMPFLPTFRRISFLLLNSPYTLHSVPSVYLRSFALAPFLHYPALHPSPLDHRTESIASSGSPRQHPASRSSSSCRMRQDGQGENKWNRRRCAYINHRISPTSEFWGRFHLALQEKLLCRHVRSWGGGVRMPVRTCPTG